MAVRRTPQTVSLVLLGTLIVAALATAPLLGFRAREPRPRLFGPASQTSADIRTGDPGIIRSRLAAIDIAALLTTIPSDGSESSRPALLLNLFDDLAFIAEVDRIDVVENGFTWVGHVWGHELSAVTLACVDGVVEGSVVMPEAVFAIQYVGDGVHEIAQVDLASSSPEASPAVTEPWVSGAAGGGLDRLATPGRTPVRGSASSAIARSVPTPIVKAPTAADVPAGASNEQPVISATPKKQINADGQSASRDSAGQPGAVVGSVIGVERPAMSFRSFPDGEPGRLPVLPLQAVVRDSNPEAAAGDGAPVRDRTTAERTVKTVVEAPEDGAEVASPFTLSGWSVDPASDGAAGIDAVQVWAFPAGKDVPTVVEAQAGPNGTDQSGTAIWVGVAAPGLPSADVGRLYGPAFVDASWRLDIDKLGPGTYDLVIYPHRTSTGQFEGTKKVRVTVR
jgi:hypothetical protein